MAMKLPKITIPGKLKSRKLWLPVLGALLVGLNDTFDWGLDSATLNRIVALVSVYVFGEAYVDSKQGRG